MAGMDHAHYIAERIPGRGDEAAAPYLRRARASRARGYQGIHPDDFGLCLEPDRFPFARVTSHEDSALMLCPIVPESP